MLREQEPQRFERPRDPRNDLEDLYRSWGVFDLLQGTIDRLPKNWLTVMNIARNLLEGKPIPGVSIPNALRALTERNVKIDYEKRLVTRKWQEPTESPSDDTEVRPIKNLTELPRVLPPHLLLADTNPDLFTYQAISSNLPISENQKPRVIVEEKSEEVEELEEVRRIGRSMRQKVYVLLDVSRSMVYNHKFTFAKAIVMAYLAKAHEENAQIYFQAFHAYYSDPRVICTTKEQFASLAKDVLRYRLVPPMILSMETVATDIGKALLESMKNVREIDQLKEGRSAATEILLITDGASFTPIPFIPPNMTLHTLHLKGSGAEYDTSMTDEQYLARIEELQSRSKTYTMIYTSVLEPLPFEKDSKILDEETKRLGHELTAKGLEASQNDEDLRSRIEKVKQMSTAYKKMYGNRGGLKDTEQRAKKMEFKSSPKGIKQAIKDALARRKLSLKRLQIIKVPRQPKLSGTLFEFRMRQDK